MKYILLTAFSIGIGVMLRAQNGEQRQVVASQGGTDRNEYIQLEWTLGETATAAVCSGSGRLTEGFHQPDLRVIKIASSLLPETRPGGAGPAAEPVVQVFPNPTAGILQVWIGDESAQVFRITLLDLTGRLIEEQKVLAPAMQKLDLISYPSGIYLLRIRSADGMFNEVYEVIKQQ